VTADRQPAARRPAPDQPRGKQAAPARKRRPARAEQQRSIATRNKLIKATIDILIEKGYVGLTVAAAARRAGVSSGARVHHYRTKDDLVIAANAFVYNEAVLLGTVRSVDAGRSAAPLKDLIADLTSLYFGRFFRASLDVMAASRTNRNLARRLYPIVAHYHAGMRAAWTKALREAGYSPQDADLAYDVILGMVRGMGLTSTWRPDVEAHLKLIHHVEQMLHRALDKN